MKGGMNRAVLGALAGAATLVLAASGLRLTYNTTPSLPLGIYRIQALDRDPRVGEIVGVCLDSATARMALARGYVHPAGLQRLFAGTRCAAGAAAIGKPVAGVPGDTVDVLPGEIRVNGVRLERSHTPVMDRSGRALPRPPLGRIVLGAGEFWLHSPYSQRSFDSRFFGPVKRRDIQDRRVPVWVQNGGTSLPPPLPQERSLRIPHTNR